jgi:hypothetical protein
MPRHRNLAAELRFGQAHDAAWLGALHCLCCRPETEYPGACERAALSLGRLGIRVQQSPREWAAFQNAAHFWADWDAAQAELWAPYVRAIRVVSMFGAGNIGIRSGRTEQQQWWMSMEAVYGVVIPQHVWKQRLAAATEQLAQKLQA